MEKPVPRPGLIATILVLMATAFLLRPMLKPPQLQEGRVLAGPPAWTGAAKLADLRHQTDAWVADRFPARPYLIGWLNAARLAIGDSGSDRVLAGRDGWLFYNDGTRLGPARAKPPLTDAEAAEWLRGLSGRVETLEGKGAAYLVVVPPAKETIYPQLGPAWFPGPSPQRTSLKLAALAARTEPGHVVHLRDPVLAVAASGTDAFSRHDTHWTGDGAYAGYAAIMQRLRAQGIDQPTRPLSDFRPVVNGVNPPRDLALMLGVASFVPIHYRGYVDPAAGDYRTTWLSERRGWVAPQVVETGQAGKPTLLLTRDSFSNALTPFLLGHFSRVVLTHIDDGFWRQDLIDRFRPDVVMLEVQEHGLGFSMRGSPPVSDAAEARIEQALPNAPTHGPLAPSAPSRGRFVRVGAAPPSLAGLDAAVPITTCAVDQALMGPHGLMVAGWISDLSSEPRPVQGALRLSGPAGDFVQPLEMNQVRPDVGAYFKRPVVEPSGFGGALSVQALPSGTYDLRVYRRSATGWIGCAGPKGLVRP
ncbi:MAG: hypothetical protein Q8N10_02060 [Phenylobacterium sp.]|uniref:alginate O-acetyltransferase AlgX-related protein n=1 Tax=Phenylobacterium sp. TaxID=1871053 RepID=UPI002719288B|nr:hypothetical protein [Phenylobacterium sp.]MDO8913337.1 hypothetical protein [Phenylobacterium sp.]MDP3099264.1 hypothetical protein [Phenylobacterium sp.]